MCSCSLFHENVSFSKRRNAYHIASSLPEFPGVFASPSRLPQVSQVALRKFFTPTWGPVVRGKRRLGNWAPGGAREGKGESKAGFQALAALHAER